MQISSVAQFQESSEIPHAINQTSTVWHTAKKIAQYILTIVLDLLMIPFAFIGKLHGVCFGTNFDPKPDKVIKDRPPILLIHGSGYDETQWIMGRHFLKGKEFGSVFSLNLDHYMFPDPENGVRDYAEKVASKVEEMNGLTGRSDVVLIGHSMGGLVGSYYKEYLAKDTTVKKMITISTPWHGSPLLKILTRFTKRFIPAIFQRPKRHCDMRNEDKFLDRLRMNTKDDPAYYAMYSTGDSLVPNKKGNLDVLPGHSKKYHWHGHFTPMICPGVWNQVQQWVKA